ncbi:hypothetical protein APSETT445_000271 [Aspergillus pseudonomiae]
MSSEKKKVYARATGHGYLAKLISAVGLVSLAYLRNAPTLTQAARKTYSWALRDVRAALADPAEASSDQMLVAVMLLVLYEAPAGNLADLIVNACAVLASVKEEATDKADLSRHMSTLLSIDQDFKCWTENLPTDYQYNTLTIPNDSGEMYLGRYDTYSGVEMVHIWNLQRCARITLHQALIDLLLLHFDMGFSQPAPLPSTDLPSTSNTVVREISSGICHSVPYILHFCDKPGNQGDLA